MYFSADYIKNLEKNMPPFFIRKDAAQATFNTITDGYLAFLACKGIGPKFVKIKGKAVYKKDDFITWLKERRYGDGRYNIEDTDFGRSSHSESCGAKVSSFTTGLSEGDRGRAEDIHIEPDGSCQDSESGRGGAPDEDIQESI